MAARRRLIALDPGTTTGWAVFGDSGRLEASGSAQASQMEQEPVAEAKGAEAVVEEPEYRTGSRTPVRDLVQLALRAGVLVGLYRAWGSKVELVRPSRWKGSVPKEIHQRRIRAALEVEEHENLAQNHNAVDAVGLGLWKLGRLKR